MENLHAYFCDMDSNIDRILDMGFSTPKDSQNLSLEDNRNSYLNSRATNVLFDVASNAVIYAIMTFYNSNEFWTKIQEKYDVSNIIEDDYIPSTSGRDEVSSPLADALWDT
jgi:hypothetical protein